MAIESARQDINQTTSAEKAIYNAKVEIGKLGSHAMLSDAEQALDYAQRKVADWVRRAAAGEPHMGAVVPVQTPASPHQGEANGGTIRHNRMSHVDATGVINAPAGQRGNPG